MVIKCNSCKKEILNDSRTAKFPCPGCGKETIVRCSECRKKSIKYECKCGFVGP